MVSHRQLQDVISIWTCFSHTKTHTQASAFTYCQHVVIIVILIGFTLFTADGERGCILIDTS